jgi:hypothetical protein
MSEFQYAINNKLKNEIKKENGKQLVKRKKRHKQAE